MFDKNKFGLIIKRINDSYPTQHDFANHSGVNRTYLSQYINMKLDAPPKPEILKKIADSSKGITSYDELMEICGYVTVLKNSLTHSITDNFYSVPVLFSDNGKLYQTNEDVMLPNNIDRNKQYFGYKVTDDSMLPLLGIGDIAIVEKTDKYEIGQTCLICLDNTTIIIRKIIGYADYIELHTAFPYGQPVKLTKAEIKERNFSILGRIVKVENTSAFK